MDAGGDKSVEVTYFNNLLIVELHFRQPADLVH